MKHKITVAVSVLVIIVALSLSVVKYEHYRNWRDVQAAKAKANAWVAQEKAKQATARQAAAISRLQDQCAKDHQLYIQTKGKSPAGDCNPSLQVVQ